MDDTIVAPPAGRAQRPVFASMVMERSCRSGMFSYIIIIGLADLLRTC